MSDCSDKSREVDVPVDWNIVDTVLLDMDGTLLDLNFDNHFWKTHVPRRFAEVNGISFEKACSQIYPHMTAIRGTLEWYSIHYWSDYLGLDIPTLKKELAYLIKPRPGVIAFLDALLLQNKTVVMTTNAHPDTLQIKFSCVALEKYFHHVVTSHELGAPKETVDFWYRLNERLPFDPARSMLVDDHPGVLTAAGEFGVANLLTIHQPDLSRPAQNHNGFYAIKHFDHITPRIQA
jgi:HAD superfamily hydrolase (TIGR01509 family)